MRTAVLVGLLLASLAHADEPPAEFVRLGSMDGRTGEEYPFLAVADDGKTVTTLTSGRLLKTWDVATGRLQKSNALGGPRSFRAVGLSSDGRQAALLDGGQIIVLDTADGSVVGRPQVAHHSTLVTFSPDGRLMIRATRYIVSGVRGLHVRTAAWLSDAGGGNSVNLGLRRAGDPGSFAFSPDGKAIFQRTEGRLACLDTATGEKRWDADEAAASFVPAADSKRLLVAFTDKPPAWLDTVTGKLIEPSPPADLRATSLVLSPDGGRLLATHDGRIDIWDMVAGKEVARIPVDDSAVFADAGRIVVTAGSVLRRWDAATGKPLDADPADAGHPDAIETVAVSPNGRIIVTADGKQLRAWSADGRPLWRNQPVGVAAGLRIAFSPDSSTVVVVCGRIGIGTAHVLDAANGRERLRFPVDRVGPNDTRQQVCDLAIAQDNRTLATAAGQGGIYRGDPDPPTLCRWELATGRRLARVEMPREFTRATTEDGSLWADGTRLYDGDGRPLRDSPAFGTFAAGGLLAAGGNVLVDVPTGGIVAELPVGKSCVSGDGRYVALADATSLRVWETVTRRLCLRFAAPTPSGSDGTPFARCLAWGPGNRVLVAGLADTTAVMWDTSSLGASGKRLTAGDLASAWADLASDDAALAWRAVARLADDPDAAVPFLAGRLSPASQATREDISAAFAGLEDRSFHRREAAERRVVALLRQGAVFPDEPRSAEQRKRWATATETARLAAPSADEARELRAIVALAWCATPAATRELRRLAAGAPGDIRTHVAARWTASGVPE